MMVHIVFGKTFIVLGWQELQKGLRHALIVLYLDLRCKYSLLIMASLGRRTMLTYVISCVLSLMILMLRESTEEILRGASSLDLVLAF